MCSKLRICRGHLAKTTDSLMGPSLRDDGPGCRALLTHIHGQLQKGTKLLLMENVCTGSTQELTAKEATSTGKMWLKVIHADTIDSGYGGCRRQRVGYLTQ